MRRDVWNSLKNKASGGPQITQRISRAARPKTTVAERRLLELLIFDRELRTLILPQLEPSDYKDLATAEIFAAIIAEHEGNDAIPFDLLAQHIDDDEESLSLAHEILSGEPRRQMDEVVDDVHREAENCVVSLRSMAISHRTLEISREAAIAEQAGDINLFNQLTYEQLDLEKIRRELQRQIPQM